MEPPAEFYRQQFAWELLGAIRPNACNMMLENFLM